MVDNHAIEFIQTVTGIDAIGPAIDAISTTVRSHLPPESVPDQHTPSVNLATRRECTTLGKRRTATFLQALTETVSELPQYLNDSTYWDASRNPPAARTFVPVLWLPAQRTRAAFSLPRSALHVAIQPTTRNATAVYLRAFSQLADGEAVDRILAHIRCEIQVNPSLRGVIDDILDVSTAVLQPNAPLHPTVLRDVLEIRVRAFAKSRRHFSHLADEVDALIRAYPSHPPPYLYRAQVHIRDKRFVEATQDVWYALLVLNLPNNLCCHAIDFLVDCLPHVPYLGLDHLFVPEGRNPEDVSDLSFESLKWTKLSVEQRDLHNTVCDAVYEKSSSCSPWDLSDFSASDLRTYSWIPSAAHTENGLVELPNHFSFLLHDRVAGCTAFSSQDQVSVLRAAGFTHVVSLTMETPLSESETWYSHLIPNTHIAVPIRRAPSFLQVDKFLATVASERRTLVHSADGSGRTGTFLASFLIAFGLDSKLSLCQKCTKRTDVLFVGCCTNEGCALRVRLPAMPASDALQIVRKRHSSFVDEGKQERFLSRFYQELCRRFGLLQDTKPDVDKLFLLYPKLDNSANDELELEYTGRKLNGPPSLIVLCGLPGSGKSSLVSDLKAKNPGCHFVIASRDTLGSREACANFVGTSFKSGHARTVIIDQCHPSIADRKESLGWAFHPKNAIIVHVDIPCATCIARAQVRVDHPTLAPCSAATVISGRAKNVQVPRQQDLQNGFAAILTIRGKKSVSSFQSWMHSRCAGTFKAEADVSFGDQSDDCDGQGTSQESAQMPSGPPMARPGQSSFAKTSDAASSTTVPNSSQHSQRLPQFYKFPRTRHLKNLGYVGSDDEVMTKEKAAEMLTFLKVAQESPNVRLVLEEKVDGANLGFSFQSETDEVVAQNRAHYVSCKSHAQFKQLKYFMDTYDEDLRRVLQKGRRILYGEWMAFRHSIHYMDLPSVFLAFDLFDVDEQRFLSRAAFKQAMNGTGISTVRSVALPEDVGVESLSDLTVRCGSAYYDGVVEGLYIRVDEGDFLVDRAKLVRPDFISGNEHWTRKQFTNNRFRSI